MFSSTADRTLLHLRSTADSTLKTLSTADSTWFHLLSTADRTLLHLLSTAERTLLHHSTLLHLLSTADSTLLHPRLVAPFYSVSYGCYHTTSSITPTSDLFVHMIWMLSNSLVYLHLRPVYSLPLYKSSTKSSTGECKIQMEWPIEVKKYITVLRLKLSSFNFSFHLT